MKKKVHSKEALQINKKYILHCRGLMKSKLREYMYKVDTEVMMRGAHCVMVNV